MALHFPLEEYDDRRAQVLEKMDERHLDALLIFAQESMYWLTGYDTFGFAFFQCLIFTRKDEFVLFTRAPDLRQAKHTSLIDDVRVWQERGARNPAGPLRDLLDDLDLLGARIGVEYNTHGLIGSNARVLDEMLRSFARAEDASDLIPPLRAVKSPAEIAIVRQAAAYGDAALEAGIAAIEPGAAEGHILAAMQSAVFEAGGDYPGNPFVIGSGPDALLCRYKSGRRKLEPQDQITMEIAGVAHHYHAALMRTVIVGEPTKRHLELYESARETIAAIEEVLKTGTKFADVFETYARESDSRGLAPHRLNACGYSLGARFAPSWMDWPMFYRDNRAEVVPDMVLFVHIILADSSSETAMTLGRTYLTTDGAPEPLSKLSLDLVTK
ncbi:M24 family metallopeptidase [Rhodobium gokarnense]|uniref:Xaa-Pro dipeptidase n=1 Tax=Rhodobium gokarnense TaxID=364296 RepID=A0ABT3H5S2_9HYPH|nr:Xaa-Pro peptidase family protein [Rhodobium gokarnense]MCW2305743.1 Xaa-Pro dipeptidase [Rhodobium gokarnense]